MQEGNLIDLEERENNEPIIINEGLDTKLLKIEDEEKLNKELECGCRMNMEINSSEMELSYKCPNCPDKMKNICKYCFENCHKNHRTNINIDFCRSDTVNYMHNPCDCALHGHKTSLLKKREESENKREEENGEICPLNQIFSIILPKYAFRRKDNNKIYCYYCLANFMKNRTLKNKESMSNIIPEEDLRISINQNLNVTKSSDDLSMEKEIISNEEDFNLKYETILIEDGNYPKCQCNDKSHKHDILSCNIDNLYECIDKYDNNINLINIDKLCYQILNNEDIIKTYFSKFIELHDLLLNQLESFEINEHYLESLKKGNNNDERNIVELDIKFDWETYFKITKLMIKISKKLKLYKFLGIPWINENLKKYFNKEIIDKILLSKSNLKQQYFKIQLFVIKMNRLMKYSILPHNLLINENMSFINRQLYKNFTGFSENGINELYNEIEKSIEIIFYLLESYGDNKKIKEEDFNDMFIEALKLIKIILPYKTNDYEKMMELFTMIENNINTFKNKKEHLNYMIHSLEKICETLFIYFNDNRALHDISNLKDKDKCDFSFLKTGKYNKEILTTLFSFQLDINENNHYIDSKLFYDNLISEKDYYSESIVNFIGCSEKWKKNIVNNLDLIIRGKKRNNKNEIIINIYNRISNIISDMLKNTINELEYLNKIKNEIINLKNEMKKIENQFYNQVEFCQNKYLFKLIFIFIMYQRLANYIVTNNKNKKKERVEILNNTKTILNEIKECLLILISENPLVSCLLMNNIIIKLILQGSIDNANFFYKLLKIMEKYEHKVDTSFLTEYLHKKFYKYIMNYRSNPLQCYDLLNIYNAILKISSNKCLLEVNNIIASDLKLLLTKEDFKNDLINIKKIDSSISNIIIMTFKCIHHLDKDYFYLINCYLDITQIINFIQKDEIKPEIKKIFVIIYADYFFIKSFSQMGIKKLMKNENLVCPNLVENLYETTNQRELQNFFGTGISLEVTPEKEIERNRKILNIYIKILEEYKYYNIKNEEYFAKGIKYVIKFFKDVILIPTFYCVYKYSYFQKSFNGTQKYDIYKLIYLFIRCYEYFLSQFISKINPNSNEFSISWGKTSDIKEINKLINTARESLSVLSQKNGKVLEFKTMFIELYKNVSHFLCIKNLFFNENINEDDEENNTFLFFQNNNLFVKLKNEVKEYRKQKADFFNNNIIDEIFQDENNEEVQNKICYDLLYKLFYSQFPNDLDIVDPNDLINNIVFNNYKTTTTSTNYFQTTVNNFHEENNYEKNEKLGYYYNSFISPYKESKSNVLENIDKCFKSNPNKWQDIIVELSNDTKNIINILISVQLPFLLQFIFMDFNNLESDGTEHYNDLVNVLEFLRLLCEDHNPLFQSMLINYEKAIGKVTLFSNDTNTFIPLISRIPIYVLSNIKHYIKKKNILSIFKSKDTNYFNPLVEKVTEFLIEIIQGTYPENFNDITTSKDNIGNMGLKDYFQKHYQYMDYLDTEPAYESVINYFFNFFNCFIEENSNPLEIKIPIILQFNPKKLMNTSIYLFKKAIYKYVGKTIDEDSSDKLTKKFIKQYEEIMEDPCFNISINIFLFITKVNSFKCDKIGDKYSSILNNLKEFYESDEKVEENSNIMLNKQYYKFCSSLVKEAEINITEDKSRSEKELLGYRPFFSNVFMREIITFRNQNCEKTQKIAHIFFVVHPDSFYINNYDVQDFSQKANYENFNEKLNSFLDYYKELSDSIEMRKTMGGPMLYLSQLNYGNLEVANVLLAILTNTCLAFRKEGNMWDKLILPFAYVHLGFLGLLLLNWYFFNSIREVKSSKSGSKILNFIKFIFVSLFNSEIFPFVWTIIAGGLAIISEKWYFLFSLQLFPIFALFDTMQSVLEAVKVRYNQFLSTGFLMVILILFYAALTFYFYRFNSDGSELCTTYLDCFMYLFNNGIRSGGVPFEIKTMSQHGFWGEFIYSWIFYFILILIILNIVNGIIVDKFQDLREQNNGINEEKENVCFICSLHRNDFERKGISFIYHTESEHNIKNYFLYLIKINRTDEHDLNSTDFQAYNAFSQHRIEFFPIKKAKCLEEE